MQSNTNEKYKYIPIKLLGKGSYGKCYLVECTTDKVNILYYTDACCNKNHCY